jgi:hypothetical protein
MATNARKTAIVVGVLFIVATAASLIGSSLTGPILDGPDYLAQASAHGNRLIVGALLSFAGAAASAGIAIALYPLLKHYGEGLALGAVGFRLIEGVFYIVGALCYLALLPVGQEFVGAGGPGNSYYQTLGMLLRTAHDLAGFVFAVLAFSLGGLIYYAVFYQTRLIPRWLSGWGIVALGLLLTATLITLFDGAPYSISGRLIILTLPIAVQELVLAVWLIARGFNTSAVGTGADAPSAVTRPERSKARGAGGLVG